MRPRGTVRDNACQLLWPCVSLDACGCGFASTAVYIELLDADELNGVGEMNVKVLTLGLKRTLQLTRS